MKLTPDQYNQIDALTKRAKEITSRFCAIALDENYTNPATPEIVKLKEEFQQCFEMAFKIKDMQHEYEKLTAPKSTP